jgi:hypothetical protein
MKVSLDIVNFKQEMQRIEEEMTVLANEDITFLIKYGTEQLRTVTPVDTGKARKGWEFKLDLKDGRGYKTGTILNRVDYIDTLNNGHSKQAPRYFIEQTLTRIGLITQ